MSWPFLQAKSLESAKEPKLPFPLCRSSRPIKAPPQRVPSAAGFVSAASRLDPFPKNNEMGKCGELRESCNVAL